jgi:N-acetylglucosamine kinase-like BadF-type ATPase
MKIIIDSGSTKTELIIISEDGKNKKILTRGLNPYFISESEIIDLVKSEISSEIDFDIKNELYFYGAGCSNSKNIEIIRNSFSIICDPNHIYIETDILGAARALFGNKSGIACILGTGSNTCLYDGIKIVDSQFSTGYIFGDEGSGSHLGKSFINLYLNNKMPPEIIEKFEKKYTLTKEDILNSVYKKPNPNRFLANFCLFLKENIHEEFIEMLVIKCFIDFFENSILEFKEPKEYKIGFIGSIGYEFKDQLEKTSNLFELKIEEILKSPIDNLQRYHSMHK